MPRPLSSTRQPPSAQQGDVDAGAEAGHRLVDGVVDDLPDEVVQTGETGGADVHARAACAPDRGLRGPGCPWRRSSPNPGWAPWSDCPAPEPLGPADEARRVGRLLSSLDTVWLSVLMSVLLSGSRMRCTPIRGRSCRRGVGGTLPMQRLTAVSSSGSPSRTGGRRDRDGSSLPTGCAVTWTPGSAPARPGGRPRGRRRSCAVDAGHLAQPRCAARSVSRRSCVAQPGRRPRRPARPRRGAPAARGRRCVAPTASSQRPNTPPTARLAARAAAASDRTTRRARRRADAARRCARRLTRSIARARPSLRDRARRTHGTRSAPDVHASDGAGRDADDPVGSAAAGTRRRW